MPLCRYQDAGGARLGWVDRERESVAPLDGSLAELLRLGEAARRGRIAALRSRAGAELPLRGVTLLAPVDEQEIWAAGVTYARSREARMEESSQGDVYDRVYDAERAEIFFKAPAWRCVGPGGAVAIRGDSSWDVPEPELALILAADGAIAGYCIGNDVSSRSIEGDNPLYLPQAKVYDASCALGPWIVTPEELPNVSDLGIRLAIERDGRTFWEGAASTRQLRRTLPELVECLYRALSFPAGAALLTGTSIVPPAAFTLAVGDVARIEIDGIGELTNRVRVLAPRR